MVIVLFRNSDMNQLSQINLNEFYCSEDNVFEAFDNGNRLEIIEKIENTVLDALISIVNNESATFNVKKSLKGNSLEFTPSFKKLATILYMLSKIFRLLVTDKYITKRELYYENVKRFQSQCEISQSTYEVCRILDVPIWQIRVKSTAKGLIAGPAIIRMKSGQMLETDNAGGFLIPQNVLDIVAVSSPAKWILIVEKDAAFQKLIQDGALDSLGPCLMVTGKGFPDVNTRMMICMLRKHLQIPIFALVDADPHGIDIMCTYRFGSQAMAGHSEGLSCTSVRWLGVHPRDIKRLGIDCVPLTAEDVNKLKKMLLRPSVLLNKEVYSEVKALLDGGVKAEMEGVAKFSPNYLTKLYLPNKILCKEII